MKLKNIGIRFIKLIIAFFGTLAFLILLIPSGVYWIFTGIDLIEKYIDFCDTLEIKEIQKQ